MSRKKIAQAAILSLAMMATVPAWAGDMPTRAEMWEMLQQQQKEIAGLKAQLGTTQTAVEHGSAKPAKNGTALSWSDRLSLSGVVEVTGSASKDYSDVGTSDISLATAELSIEGAITELVTASITLLYEDDGGTPLTVDAATVTIGNTEKYPVYLTAGQMGIPFGNFTSNLISDPLTLDMAETYESTVQLGFEKQGFYGSLFAFNGASKQSGDKDIVEHVGANLGYAMENASLSLDAGVSYISSLADTNTMTNVLNSTDADKGAKNAVDSMADTVAGIGAYGVLGYSNLTIIGEYITAAEEFDTKDLPWGNAGATPATWNMELGYSFVLAGKDATLAAAWQGSSEALALGLPEKRYLAALSVGIFNNTSLSVEWLHDQDYEVSDSRTGEKADTGTVELAVEF